MFNYIFTFNSYSRCDITADSLSGDSKLILEEITQHLNLEKRLQTYKYPITIACLKAIRKLQKFGHLPNNPNIFRSYSSYGNFIGMNFDYNSNIIYLKDNFFIEINYFRCKVLCIRSIS